MLCYLAHLLETFFMVHNASRIGIFAFASLFALESALHLSLRWSQPYSIF
jgi:hypothetical protein